MRKLPKPIKRTAYSLLGLLILFLAWIILVQFRSPEAVNFLEALLWILFLFVIPIVTLPYVYKENKPSFIVSLIYFILTTILGLFNLPFINQLACCQLEAAIISLLTIVISIFGIIYSIKALKVL